MELRSCLRTIMSVRAGFWFTPLLSGRDPFSSPPFFILPRHPYGMAVSAYHFIGDFEIGGKCGDGKTKENF